MAVLVRQPRARRWVALSVGSVAVGVALAWWIRPDEAPRVALHPAAAEGAPTASPTDAAQVPGATRTVALHAGMAPLPASLEGTEPPGPVEQDERGDLKLTPVLRDLFDYFLSTTGEEPVDRQRARLKTWLDTRLGARAAGQALALFDTYTAYKADLMARMGDARPGSVAEMRARVADLRAARARHFAPDVLRAFFGEEETFERYSLERIAVLRDTTLAPQDKARRLAELRAGLPDSLRQEQDVVEVVETLGTLTSDLQARSGSPGELRQLRETLVGAEAANRLETLDRETAAWNHRVAAYLQQRAQILGDTTLADSTRQARLDALRSEGFSSTERLRIESIERIEEVRARDASPVPRVPRSG